jgi:hypothetical protein
MKTKRFFLFGLPAVLLALGLVFVSCDNGTNGGEEGGFDSRLVATWHSTQTAAENGDSALFWFEGDGSLTIASQSNMIIKATTSGGTLSMTSTSGGQTFDGGSIKYEISGTLLKFSNPTAGGSIANILNSAQSLVNPPFGDGYFHKSGSSSGDKK